MVEQRSSTPYVWVRSPLSLYILFITSLKTFKNKKHKLMLPPTEIYLNNINYEHKHNYVSFKKNPPLTNSSKNNFIKRLYYNSDYKLNIFSLKTKFIFKIKNKARLDKISYLKFTSNLITNNSLLYSQLHSNFKYSYFFITKFYILQSLFSKSHYTNLNSCFTHKLFNKLTVYNYYNSTTEVTMSHFFRKQKLLKSKSDLTLLNLNNQNFKQQPLKKYFLNNNYNTKYTTTSNRFSLEILKK